MPVPQGGRRQAVADQVLPLMQVLHAHHTAEDSGLWPLVRQRNPAGKQLLAQALTARDLGAWNQTYNIKPKSPWQLGLDGQWLLDEIDPEGYQVVVQQVPAVPRFILLHGFARLYRRRRSAWWSSDAPDGHTAAPGRLPSRAGRTGDLPDTAPPPPGG